MNTLMARMTPKDSACAQYSSGIAASSTARVRSAPSISRRGRVIAATRAPARPSGASPAYSAASTTPIRAGEPVVVSTNQGRATAVISVPVVEIRSAMARPVSGRATAGPVSGRATTDPVSPTIGKAIRPPTAAKPNYGAFAGGPTRTDQPRATTAAPASTVSGLRRHAPQRISASPAARMPWLTGDVTGGRGGGPPGAGPAPSGSGWVPASPASPGGAGGRVSSAVAMT